MFISVFPEFPDLEYLKRLVRTIRIDSADGIKADGTSEPCVENAKPFLKLFFEKGEEKEAEDCVELLIKNRFELVAECRDRFILRLKSDYDQCKCEPSQVTQIRDGNMICSLCNLIKGEKRKVGEYKAHQCSKCSFYFSDGIITPENCFRCEACKKKK